MTVVYIVKNCYSTFYISYKFVEVPKSPTILFPYFIVFLYIAIDSIYSISLTSQFRFTLSE